MCRERGLTGTQGVAIPDANVQHLMLREDIVESCAEGRFAVYPIRTIDEGITLLTGHRAGERDDAGHYPDGTINNLVETKLQLYAETLRRFGKPDAGLNSELHKDEMP